MSSNINYNSYLPLREDIASMHNGLTTKSLNNLNNSLGVKVLNNSNNTGNQLNYTMLMTPLSSQNRSRSPSPTRPLIKASNAPLANLETDDETDDREVMNRPYPGVDDGFFTNEDNGTRNERPPQDSANPDVEYIPTAPKEPEETNHAYPHFPGISPRAGGDGDSINPDNKPPTEPPQALPPQSIPEFPSSPGFRPWGWDLEVGSTLPSGETIPDLNVYQHKKTLAQGMMDLALFSANANQLRYVLETFRTHPYYYPSLILISISLLMQIGVGVGLIWNATFNVRDQKALCVANKINNFTIIGVFLVTVINVFISAFGVAPAPP